MEAEPSLQAAPEAPEIEREELRQSEAADRQAHVAYYEQRLREQQEHSAAEQRRVRDVARQRALETEQRIALVAAEQQRTLDAEQRRYEAILAEERRRLNDALWELSVLGASRGVRAIKLLRAAHAVLQRDGPRALAKQATLWMRGKRSLSLPDNAAVQPIPMAVLAPTLATPGRKAVMYISLQSDNAMRYRCEHHAEALGYMGCTSDMGIYGRVSLGDVANHYACFVLHRIPYAPDVASFIADVQRQGKSVFFDTDDWIFDTEVARYVPSYNEMDGNRQTLFRWDLTRIQQTMRACDGVIVSTESLRALALKHHSNVLVVPNAVSRAMIQGGNAALEQTSSARRLARHDTVTIGYFSGTPTHNGDFPEAADAILWALEQYPEAVLKVVGLLKLDKRFERFGPRVVRIDLQPWQELPQIYTTIDINIAPLERENPFTDAKSCVKYLEAALCEVPTIASARTDFRRVIVHCENGLLVDTQDEWKAALRQLIESPQLRREMGLRAAQRVRAEETTLARSATVQPTLRTLAIASDPDVDTQPLIVNWVLDAHSGEQEGGYHTIFRLANYLGRQGHVVRVYLLPVGHLADMSHDEIQAYVSEHFGPLSVELYIGHERIAPADVTIATSWTTANVVERHRDSLHKAYLIQDFGPASYNPGDPTYVEAQKTFDLPLRHICIGASLGYRIEELSARKSEIIDVAIDQTIFQMRRVPEDRKGPIQVLFFVRKGMKRQEYELGIEALNRVKAQRPDVDILLVGSPEAELCHLPFPGPNLGELRQSELTDVLNRVHVLLSFSPSETSWVAFAGMACGAAVVEADMESVGGIVSSDESWVRAQPDVESLAAAVVRLVDDDGLRCQVAKNGTQFMSQRTWEHTGRQLEDVLVAGCWPRERRQVVTSQQPMREDTPSLSQ
jgi:glycosyltransferase involved in cell wall biosynthesis